MNLKKVPTSKRFRQEKDGSRTPIYTMIFANGDKVIYEPGKVTTIYKDTRKKEVQYDDAITELTIKYLYQLDDAEVESNLNYIHCETRGMRKEREKNKREWIKNHPNSDNDKNPYNAICKLKSLDYKPNDDFKEDSSKVLYDAVNNIDINSLYDESSDNCELRQRNEEMIISIRTFVSTLPKRQQELYQLIYIDGLSQVQVCEKLHLSKSTISERCKILEQKIINKFKK